MPTELDRETFSDRLARLYSHWQNNKKESGDLDAICVISGSQNEESYLKSTSIQQWLFGVEINDSAIIFLDKTVVFIASAKKIAFFKQVEQGKENRVSQLAYKFIQREKGGESDTAHFKEATDLIKKSHGGHRLGVFIKEKHEGEFVAGWNKAVDQAGFERVDASAMIAYVLACKDDKELACVKKASEITNKVFSKGLKDQIINIIDGEKKVKHAKLADTVEEAIKDSKFVSQDDRDLVETCYPAIIQSGGAFSLKFSATSDKNVMHFGCIVCAMGFRYKNYCSNLVRTLMVDPTERMQENYKFLLKLEEELIDLLRDGQRINQVYDKIKGKCEEERPDLVDKLTPNFGFVIGLEFREPSLLITNKCTAEIKSGMTFQVSIGFSDLVNPEGKDEASRKYALFIGDTIQVNKENEPPILLTQAKKKIENVGIFIKEEDESGGKENDDDEADSRQGGATGSSSDILSRVTRGAVLQNKTRSDTNQEQARRDHQKELLKKLNADAKDRLLNSRGAISKEKIRKVVTAYRNAAQMPYSKSEVQELKIYVDKHHESVVLPVFGAPTPFHISTIKNLSTSVEGDYTYLRLNFFHPGVAVNKAAIEATVLPVAADAPQEDVFIKELTYRASNLKESGELSSPSTNLILAYKLIKDMQKEYKEKEHEEREKEGMVKQDTLIISNNKNNPKLKDLYVRPSTTQKRITGTLEAHTNGFLYTSVRNEKLEILYNNIKHSFFQPCDSEIIILVHFHLKNAIMFGKKKYTDIQFYTEVGEVTTDLGKHNRGGDRDDILAEQAEREMRRKLNMAFKSFIEKVETLTNNQLSFEKPFRELGFQGTPFRSMALLQPTTSCLVNLTEQPTFVLTLDQVEIVHFERVSFSLKNFDMVFIFKDYTRKVVMVTSIPMSQIDQIKEWLNSCDIKYTEGVQSFNWPKIMKTINDDLKGFFETGGWSFLEADSDNEKDGDQSGMAGSDDSDAEDDVYEPSGSESEFSESDDDDDDESEYTESSESGSGSGSDDDDSEESGKDWSDLEEEARRADMERDSDDDDDGGAASRKRKKPAAASSSAKNAPKRAKK